MIKVNAANRANPQDYRKGSEMIPYLTQDLPENPTVEVPKVVLFPFAKLFRVVRRSISSGDDRDRYFLYR